MRHGIWVFHPWRCGIEVLEVHGGKPAITLEENTVDEQYDKFN
jgi:hypothetical protein